MNIKTLLVDDSIAFLNTAGRYLATQPVDVVGKAQTGLKALALNEALKPDLVLLDLELGVEDGMNGMAVLRAFTSQPHPPRIVVVTLHDQEEYRNAVKQAGADGFISKREFVTALAPLIHTLFNDAGEAGFSGTTTK